ncbi:hypothetical protein DPMN_119420 [Dreissena polymorpha]|uniref:C2H2-type domain-containing protein n=1 Tax=Dreissena polymorpha TaxID=45954 RepID=A0A9D4JPE6_DREPO|nr:hypothetical protein DPMN_119420 [Dreissena polymorpha]
MADSKQDSKHICQHCEASFDIKSNLIRHLKTHSVPSIKCDQCDKTFTLNQHLKRHKIQHDFYPVIPKYNDKEARLKPTERAILALNDKEVFDAELWNNVDNAEKQAKLLGGEMWRACLILPWGKYPGKSFKWFLENDIGWLLAEFSL